MELDIAVSDGKHESPGPQKKPDPVHPVLDESHDVPSQTLGECKAGSCRAVVAFIPPHAALHYPG